MFLFPFQSHLGYLPPFEAMLLILCVSCTNCRYIVVYYVEVHSRKTRIYLSMGKWTSGAVGLRDYRKRVRIYLLICLLLTVLMPELTVGL